MLLIKGFAILFGDRFESRMMAFQVLSMTNTALVPHTNTVLLAKPEWFLN